MKTESSSLLIPPGDVRPRRRTWRLTSPGKKLALLASTLILGGLLVGLSLVRTRSKNTLDPPSYEKLPAITTAENLKWTRCEEDDSMFCTVFT